MDRMFGDMSQFLRDSIPYRGLLLTEITPYLESFLHQLRTGAVLHLQHETKPGFLKLTIVARNNDWLQVEFGLPDDKWSHKQFDQVHAAMLHAGYRNYVEENPDNEEIRRFLRVYVQDNWTKLTAIVLQVLELAASNLGFELSDRFTLRIAGVANFHYMNELSTAIDQAIRRTPRGRAHLGRLISGFFHRLVKLYDDKP